MLKSPHRNIFLVFLVFLKIHSNVSIQISILDPGFLYQLLIIIFYLLLMFNFTVRHSNTLSITVYICRSTLPGSLSVT